MVRYTDEELMRCMLTRAETIKAATGHLSAPLLFGTYEVAYDAARALLEMPACNIDTSSGVYVFADTDDSCLNVVPAQYLPQLLEAAVELLRSSTADKTPARACAAALLDAGLFAVDHRTITLTPDLAAICGGHDACGSLVVVGNADHLEVWDPRAWAEYVDDVDGCGTMTDMASLFFQE